MVWSIVISHSMGGLECFKELLEDLVFGSLSRENIRVLSGIVDSSDIIEVDPTISVLIKLLEGFSNKLLSGVVHWSSNGSNEFIKFNKTTSVEIEVSKEFLDFSFSESEHVVSHGFGELILVEGSGVVVIHDLELSLKTDETSGTSGLKLCLQCLGKLLWCSVSLVGNCGLWSDVQTGSKLFI